MSAAVVAGSRLTVTRLSLKEAVSRRLLLAGVLLSAAFVALFALGFRALYSRAEAADDASGFLVTFAAATMTVLGLYVVQFLTSFLAMFLAVGSVSSEIDSGMLHAVLARPLARSAWLAQRWLAFAVTAALYSAVMAGSLLLVAHAVAGYQPVHVSRALALLVLEALVLLAIGMAGSTLWSTLANGAVVFSLFGLAWLAGIIEFAGEAVDNDAMRNIGVAVSLLVPSDALWRGASYYLQTPAALALTADGGGIPFAASAPPAGALVAWSAAYVVVLMLLAAWRFRHRDL